MTGFESCTSSASENSNLHNSIIQDSQDSLGELQESRNILSEEALQSLISAFDEVVGDNIFDTNIECQSAIMTAIYRGLKDYIDILNFGDNPLTVNEFFEIVDDIFEYNSLSPIRTSTIISVNEEGKYYVSGSISKLSCSPILNTSKYTPQGLFEFEIDKKIFIYGESLYSFPGLVLGRYSSSSKIVSIFPGEIDHILYEFNDGARAAFINIVIANELGHLQFDEIIMPKYGLSNESIFQYNGVEYSLRQVGELWSDYASTYFAYSNQSDEDTTKASQFELGRIQSPSGIENYDLSRLFFNDRFEELFSGEGTLETFFQDMEDDIIAILESAKN